MFKKLEEQENKINIDSKFLYIKFDIILNEYIRDDGSQNLFEVINNLDEISLELFIKKLIIFNKLFNKKVPKDLVKLFKLEVFNKKSIKEYFDKDKNEIELLIDNFRDICSKYFIIEFNHMWAGEGDAHFSTYEIILNRRYVEEGEEKLSLYDFAKICKDKKISQEEVDILGMHFFIDEEIENNIIKNILN